MEVSMLINEGENGTFSVILVHKIFSDQVTPIRTILDVFNTKDEAEEFANTFVKTLSNSKIQFT